MSHSSEKCYRQIYNRATALVATGEGSYGSLGSFAPNPTAAQSNSIEKPKIFFIAEILRLHASEGKDRSAGRVAQNQVFKTKSCDGTPGRNLRRLVPEHALRAGRG